MSPELSGFLSWIAFALIIFVVVFGVAFLASQDAERFYADGPENCNRICESQGQDWGFFRQNDSSCECKETIK